MKYADVAENVRQLLVDMPSHDEFIYELLLAYGKPKASITRLKQGTYNQSNVPGEVLWKKEVWFKVVDGDLFATIEELKTAKGTKAHNPRFLFVTDFEQILAIDRKTDDTLDIKFPELETNFDFFLPWAGMEKTKLSNENPADIKAAEKMAKLFDAIKLDNPQYMREDAHAMNVFLGRLLFCLFAEDTGIFPENAVTNAVASHTDVDGSDLDAFFKRLFDLLDTVETKRGNIEEHLRCFPYVNGGLFREHFDIPTFSAKSRRMIIESGELNWSEINPDIFGSMFQAVIDPEERHNLGQHYTSVTNIMKVIEPLFLNDFKADLEKASNLTKGKKQALQRLLDRIAHVKIFDPACGSGNFLIIAYKELRKLEMDVFRELQAIEGTFPISGMNVNRFYGIEIADFACETAILALWLAEHQMNLEYKKIFGRTLVSLPLKEGANIVCGNATCTDWESVCPKNDGDEIYVLGNPPYLGSSVQNKSQKEDMAYVFSSIKNYKNLDYIACWFLKGAAYIKGSNTKFAFVSTNSICQGEQVALLWPYVFNKELEIGFAHQSFKWSNNAKGSAGVTCVIIGLRNEGNETTSIYRHGVVQNVKAINAYLTAGNNIIIRKRTKPLSAIPNISYGSKPVDGGNLILNENEKSSLISESPDSEKFIKKFVGSNEFIKGSTRWCLWIEDDDLSDAISIPSISARVERVKSMRLASKKAATRKISKRPHSFGEIRHKKSHSIIIPEVSSERRVYIPIGFLDDETVISNLAYSIPSANPLVFGIISSKMHMAWVRTVAGQLETRIRYSAGLCYNTFPIPKLTKDQIKNITMHVEEVLEEREKYSQKTMAQLYDPDKMPDGLREAHHNLDLAVDRIYRTKPFASDEERLEHLFKLYEEMTAKEKLV